MWDISKSKWRHSNFFQSRTEWRHSSHFLFKGKKINLKMQSKHRKSKNAIKKNTGLKEKVYSLQETNIPKTELYQEYYAICPHFSSGVYKRFWRNSYKIRTERNLAKYYHPYVIRILCNIHAIFTHTFLRSVETLLRNSLHKIRMERKLQDIINML